MAGPTPKAWWTGPGERAATIALLLPPAFYLWFIGHFGVSVPYQDDWSLVPLVRSVHRGALTLAALWAQHLQNRVLFPNLIMLVLIAASRFNTKVEMFAGAALLIAGFVFVALAQRRVAHRSWALLLPAALVCFSLIQYLTALHGYALSLYLIVAAAAAAVLALLLSERHGWLWFGLAALLGAVASYSSLQGVAVWPAGLALLASRGRPPRACLAWTGAGVLTAGIYLLGFHFGADNHAAGWALQHPLDSLRYLLLLAAGVVPEVRRVGLDVGGLTVLGAVIWILGAVALISAMQNRGPGQALSVSAAIVVLVAAIDLLTVLGRARVGLGFALAPRYTVFNLWLLAAVYLGALELVLRPRRRILVAAFCLVAALLLVQVGASLHRGLEAAGQLRSQHLAEVELVQHYEDATSAQIYRLALQDTGAFRPLARVLDQERLSVFG